MLNDFAFSKFVILVKAADGVVFYLPAVAPYEQAVCADRREILLCVKIINSGLSLGFPGKIGKASNVNGMPGCAGYVAASAAYAVFCTTANMAYFSLMLSNISKKLHSFKSDTIFLIDISESLFDILVTILLMVTSSTKRCLAISLYFIPAQS